MPYSALLRQWGKSAKPSLRDLVGLRKRARVKRKPTEIVLADKAKSYDVRLTPWEVEKMAKLINKDFGHKDLTHFQQNIRLYLDKEFYAREERLMILSYRDKIYTTPAFTGMEALTIVLFSIVGTHIAGEAGLNVLGVVLVGAVSSLGGQSLNEVLVGRIGDKGAVFWIRDPRWLALAVGSSIVTFHCWPIYETRAAESWIAQFQRAAGVSRGEDISLAQFEHALEEDGDLRRQVRRIVAQAEKVKTEVLDCPEGRQRMFAWLDSTESGMLETVDLQRLARLQVLGSPVFYGLESILTGCAGVSAAVLGFASQAHPIICCCLGVSICFGGVLRDLICKRDVALGSSSFALACLLSSTVYTALREVHQRSSLVVPLSLRIVLSIGAGVCQRAYCWYVLEPGTHALPRMANYAGARRYDIY